MKVISLGSVIDPDNRQDYIEALTTMIDNYFKEVHSDSYCGSYGKAYVMAMEWIRDRWVYLVLDNNNKPVGFMECYVYDQMGMVKEYLVIDYMYVVPEARRTRATQWLWLTGAKVALELKIDIVASTFIKSSNYHNASLMDCEHLSTVMLYKREKFINKFNKYARSLNVSTEEV